MTALAIARRVVLEVVRDRRTLAFFLLAPLLVMTLVYYAVKDEEHGRVGIVARGVARLFERDLEDALRESEDIEVVSLAIADEEIDGDALVARIETLLRRGEADGVLYLSADFLPARVRGERGTLHIYVEGSRPTRTAAVLSGIASAMDDLAGVLPVMIDASCSSFCASSVNAKALDLEEHFLHGSDEYRLIDFFLPILPPFFAFFFTFILSTVTFQRERVRGTLERMLVAPVAFSEIVAGYLGGFLAFAALQATIVVAFFVSLTRFPIGPGQLAALAVVMLLVLAIALSLGLLASFVAQNELQALQFIPVVMLPQIFLSDIIWDVGNFPFAFRLVSWALPLTHANAAVREVLIRDRPLWASWPELLVLCGFIAAIVLVLTLVQKRRKAW